MSRKLNDVVGQSADAGLVTRLGGFRLAGEGGMTRYDGTGDFGFGSLTATGPLGRVGHPSEFALDRRING